MTAQTNRSLPTSSERDSSAPRVAAELAESLRAMRRNARNAYVSARPGASYSITMDAGRLGDLTNAADLIERQTAELAEWRSVFGHLGATPDDCGNAIGAARSELADEAEFHRRRTSELQRWQSRMRDPERTVVCDILANGKTFPPEFAGDRYTVKDAPAVRLTDEQIHMIFFPLGNAGRIELMVARMNARDVEAAVLAANGKAVS